MSGLTIAAALLSSLGEGCSSTAPPRPQLVVVVDTDAPVPDELFARPEMSGDAAVDTLRVDAIATSGPRGAYDLRTFLAPGLPDWPISFGVAANDAAPSGHVRLRLRAFRGQLATSGQLAGLATLDPPAEVTIDRIIDLDLPAEGIRRVHVVLRGDCMGVLGSFVDPVTTCIDGDHLKASPTEGLDEIGSDAPATIAGTWTGAVEVPCSGIAPAGVDTRCIPGGFSVLGDEAFRGIGDGMFEQDSVPLRPVRVSPFFMDRTEVTVGALRQIVKSGYGGDLPVTANDPNLTFSQFCTWLGPDDASNDDMPVNCETYAGARAICKARGGDLPTEAQWEHAARGRGRHTFYPWGNETPNPNDCCLTSASRAGTPDIPTSCPGSGMEPVGSHPATAACADEAGVGVPIGDVSRDGIVDMAGSVTEVMLDSLKPYEASCWSKPGGGILIDPSCIDDSVVKSSRGGYWNSGLASTAAPFRYSFSAQKPSQGLRCVYPGGSL